MSNVLDSCDGIYRIRISQFKQKANLDQLLSQTEMTLDQSGQSCISLRNTIDYLHRYIEMEKIRNVNFNCQITIDPALEMDETILPPMLIQPFIENAIWHGAIGKHKRIEICIEFKKQNKQL